MKLNEQQLRDAVAKALMGEGAQIMAEAAKHVDIIIRLDAEGRIAWRTIPSPAGSRSFDGAGEGYTVLVSQYNAAGRGIGHAGMASCAAQGLAIVLLADQAERLYRAAAARMN